MVVIATTSAGLGCIPACNVGREAFEGGESRAARCGQAGPSGPTEPGAPSTLDRVNDATPHGARGLPHEVHDLLREQRWLATPTQLTAAGLTRGQIRWGLQRRWSAPLPGVIRVADGDIPDADRPVAAHLHAGPMSVLAGASAAAAYGITAAQSRDGVVHVLVPGSRSARRVRWVHVHRTGIGDARVRTVDGVPTSSTPRAIVDAARWAATDDAAAAIAIEACQRNLVTPQALHDLLEGMGHAPGTGRARRAVAAADTGAWSVPERDLADLVARSTHLPTPWLNPTLRDADGTRLTSPDMWFDGVGLAVMVHSKAHHSIGADWTRTVESDSELSSRGVHVLGITPTTIRQDPARARGLVERAYATASRLGRAPGIVARRR